MRANSENVRVAVCPNRHAALHSDRGPGPAPAGDRGNLTIQDKDTRRGLRVYVPGRRGRGIDPDVPAAALCRRRPRAPDIQPLSTSDRCLSELVRAEAITRLAGLLRLNQEVDIRHKRRSLTADEVDSLVSSARSSGVSLGSSTVSSAPTIYVLSDMTGLRRKELGSFSPRNFELDGDPPTVTAEAAASKHRRKDVLPLHPELVAMLRQWLKGLEPRQKLFPKLERKKTWFMVKKDPERIGVSSRRIRAGCTAALIEAMCRVVRVIGPAATASTSGSSRPACMDFRNSP